MDDFGPEFAADVRARVGDRRVVLSVSGGKDSAAASLYLRELGIEHERVFADTGWEHPKTYEYLRGPLTAALGPIHEVAAEKGFAELVRHKRIFPDRTKRFCTVILKVEPIAEYLKSLDEEIVNVVGIRRDESASRKAAKEWEYSKTLDCDVWRPIVSWSVAEVIAIHRRHGLAPNPLYGMGATRVGCWPCIHARKSDIRLVADTDPERIDEIRELELEVMAKATAVAHGKGKELDWIRSLFSIRESKSTPDGTFREPWPEEIEEGSAKPGDLIENVRRKHRPMPIDEAVAWARTESPAERGKKKRALELFEDPQSSCGEWGFCETGGSE